MAALCDGCRTSEEQGRSTIEMLEPLNPPTANAKGTASIEDNKVVNALDPELIGDLAKPVYPPNAMAGHAGRCIVFVTITISTAVEVSEVIPSWQRLNIPNRYSNDFLEAVRAATRKWKFKPARNVYWEKDPSGDLKYKGTEIVPARIDIKFTFEASGIVR